MKSMGKNLFDILTTWTINLTVVIGMSQVDWELILRNAVLLATLLYTFIKIISALKQIRRKKEIKEED